MTESHTSLASLQSPHFHFFSYCLRAYNRISAMEAFKWTWTSELWKCWKGAWLDSNASKTRPVPLYTIITNDLFTLINFAGDSAFCATENNITKLAGTWEKQSQASVGWFNHLTINEPLIQKPVHWFLY